MAHIQPDVCIFLSPLFLKFNYFYCLKFHSLRNLTRKTLAF
ncbi:hypothetical protein NEILACOT_04278 [Neisseria lactamica ATCC 23970]|uniref:Uncharacterized protein n=1 Tax=Neisseria lactamica ATCC 23970 TaxID=546265 RepID=D0W9R6_NEILA|nr:hypothetical protein NEILACOT_04278 [Neisseria lactamica ATCC 23970]